MKSQKALRVLAPLVVFGLLAVFALRPDRLSSPVSEGKAALKDAEVRAVKPGDLPNRAAPAPPRGTGAGRERPASGAFVTRHSLLHTAVLSYGNGRDQIGRLSGTDLRAGPESFWVDRNGQVYVCDTVNRKIKVFSASGALIRETDMGFAVTDMVVSDSGDMFVLDMSRVVVEQFGPDGAKKASVALNGTLAENAARLRVDGNEVVLQTNQQNEVTLTQGGKADLLSEVSELSARAGLSGLNGKRFQTLRTELGQGQVTVFDDAGTVIRKLTLPVEGQVASVVYLGQDQTDHSYFQVETSAVNGVELSVYSLGPDGSVVSVIPQIPNDYSSWTAKLLEIDNAGNIYQMLPAESGVEMNMWQRN